MVWRSCMPQPAFWHNLRTSQRTSWLTCTLAGQTELMNWRLNVSLLNNGKTWSGINDDIIA